jgi:putative ABC transport system permease protein
MRKINGARIREIMTMLNLDLLTWIMISFVMAVPLALLFMNKWLESFAYKITLSWWIFAMAGFTALLIALLTVSAQSWKAANRNPVEALKHE